MRPKPMSSAADKHFHLIQVSQPSNQTNLQRPLTSPTEAMSVLKPLVESLVYDKGKAESDLRACARIENISGRKHLTIADGFEIPPHVRFVYT